MLAKACFHVSAAVIQFFNNTDLITSYIYSKIENIVRHAFCNLHMGSYQTILSRQTV